MMMATMMMMTTMRRHLGICGYCREANTPHFHQHSLPDDDVRDDDDDDDNDGDDDEVRCDEDDDDHDDDDGESPWAEMQEPWLPCLCPALNSCC